MQTHPQKIPRSQRDNYGDEVVDFPHDNCASEAFSNHYYKFDLPGMFHFGLMVLVDGFVKNFFLLQGLLQRNFKQRSTLSYTSIRMHQRKMKSESRIYKFQNYLWANEWNVSINTNNHCTHIRSTLVLHLRS